MDTRQKWYIGAAVASCVGVGFVARRLWGAEQPQGAAGEIVQAPPKLGSRDAGEVLKRAVPEDDTSKSIEINNTPSESSSVRSSMPMISLEGISQTITTSLVQDSPAPSLTQTALYLTKRPEQVSHTARDVFGVEASDDEEYYSPPTVIPKFTGANYSEDEEGNKVVNDYSIMRTIGEGAYGKVKLVVHNPTNQLYAVKVLKPKKSKRFDTIAPEVIQEVAIMKRLDHPNIVKLHKVIQDTEYGKVFLVMDYVSKGALGSVNPSTGQYTFVTPDGAPFDEAQVRLFARDIITGLRYLHRHKIIHRDIKPDNVMLSNKGYVQIGDFGLAVKISRRRTATQTLGTPAYISPETFDGVMTGAIDIWALGCTLYCLAMGSPPFKGRDLDELVAAAKANIIDMKAGWSDDFQDVLRRTLDANYKTRITLEQLSEHSWVTKGGELPPIAKDSSAKFVITDGEYNRAIEKEKGSFKRAVNAVISCNRLKSFLPQSDGPQSPSEPKALPSLLSYASSDDSISDVSHKDSVSTPIASPRTPEESRPEVAPLSLAAVRGETHFRSDDVLTISPSSNYQETRSVVIQESDWDSTVSPNKHPSNTETENRSETAPETENSVSTQQPTAPEQPSAGDTQLSTSVVPPPCLSTDTTSPPLETTPLPDGAGQAVAQEVGTGSDNTPAANAPTANAPAGNSSASTAGNPKPNGKGGKRKGKGGKKR